MTIRKNQDQPVTIFDQSVTVEVRYKQIDIPYTPNSNGLYMANYTLTTYSNSYMDNWCKTTQDYVEQTESIIEVGAS